MGAAARPESNLAPQIAGPLAANPESASIDAGAIGPVYVTGAVSALGLSQTHPVLIVQKNDGRVQLYAQAGAYSIPVIGLPYVRTEPSLVKARHIASGRGFGNGDSTTQARLIVETGLLF